MVDVRMYRTHKEIAMEAKVSILWSLFPGVIGSEVFVNYNDN